MGREARAAGVEEAGMRVQAWKQGRPRRFGVLTELGRVVMSILAGAAMVAGALAVLLFLAAVGTEGERDNGCAGAGPGATNSVNGCAAADLVATNLGGVVPLVVWIEEAEPERPGVTVEWLGAIAAEEYVDDRIPTRRGEYEIGFEYWSATNGAVVWRRR